MPIQCTEFQSPPSANAQFWKLRDPTQKGYLFYREGGREAASSSRWKIILLVLDRTMTSVGQNGWGKMDTRMLWDDQS